MRSFEKIDDVKMEFSVQITFRQQWYDNRLEYDDMGGKIKYLTMTDSTKVWMPDTFFRNEKQGKFHNIIQPNLYVRIFPNGDVRCLPPLCKSALSIQYYNWATHAVGPLPKYGAAWVSDEHDAVPAAGLAPRTS